MSDLYCSNCGLQKDLEARTLDPLVGTLSSDDCRVCGGRFQEGEPDSREWHRARAIRFRLMARMMAGQVPSRDGDQAFDFHRASGDVACGSCGLAYRDHPAAPEGAHLVLLCGGARVKL